MKHKMLETEDFEKEKCNACFKSGTDQSLCDPGVHK